MSPAVRWTLLFAVALAVILVPFALFGESITEWAEAVLTSDRSKPYFAALLFALLASDVVMPIPATVVCTAAGYLLGFGLGAAVIFCGMTTSALVGYAIGARWGRGVTRRWVGERELERAERLHRRWGPAAILLLRGMPVLAEASAVFAGVAGMRRGRFVGLVVISNAVVATAYAALGAKLFEMS